MQNIDPSLLQELLQNNSDGSGQAISLFPESFMNLLTAGFIVLNIVTILFLIAYVFSTIRRWKVQSAILTMQKDIREIKESLGSNVSPKV
jgi:hypothetical protein